MRRRERRIYSTYDDRAPKRTRSDRRICTLGLCLNHTGRILHFLYSTSAVAVSQSMSKAPRPTAHFRSEPRRTPSNSEPVRRASRPIVRIVARNSLVRDTSTPQCASWVDERGSRYAAMHALCAASMNACRHAYSASRSTYGRANSPFTRACAPPSQRQRCY